MPHTMNNCETWGNFCETVSPLCRTTYFGRRDTHNLHYKFSSLVTPSRSFAFFFLCFSDLLLGLLWSFRVAIPNTAEARLIYTEWAKKPTSISFPFVDTASVHVRVGRKWGDLRLEIWDMGLRRKQGKQERGNHLKTVLRFLLLFFPFISLFRFGSLPGLIHPFLGVDFLVYVLRSSPFPFSAHNQIQPRKQT